MPVTRVAWRSPSLRGTVISIAGTVVLLLTGTLLVLVWVLRGSQADLVNRSNKHLEGVSHSLADAYQNRANRAVSLTTANPEPPPRPPGAPAPPRPPAPPSRPPPPPMESAAGWALQSLTANVLRDEDGVEGGYFRPSDRRLVGYAFPTHEGPGDPAALPARETPSIADIALKAIDRNQVQQETFYGAHDVVLFTATPVCDAEGCPGGPVGAAWLMQRLAGAESGRRRALLWSALGFSTVACVTVILAFVVLTRVNRGTHAVLERLARMEVDLSDEEHPASVRLAEFHRVLDGLHRLGGTLRSQIARERELQNRLRQNERLAAIGQVAAGVAHELRNPLATIRLRSQMTQRRTVDDSAAQTAGVVLAEVDRLDAIIERLLNFTRPVRLHLTSVDISEVCSLAVARWTARSPTVKFAFLGGYGISATSDQGRLEQVIDNVVENAVHQLREAGTVDPMVTVACSISDEGLALIIQDNGGGFTPEALVGAAQPFFTTRAGGTGLGLSITQEIVTALGGTLSFRNGNGGAIVSVLLPPAENAVI